jgi:hypothetical protein
VTTTFKPTTPTTLPAGLNLDGYCPPEIRHALNQSAAELEELVGHFEEIARRAYAANSAFDDHTSDMDLFDDHWIVFGDLTGYNRHASAARRLLALAEVACGEPWTDEAGAGQPPSWLESSAQRRAINEESR